MVIGMGQIYQVLAEFIILFNTFFKKWASELTDAQVYNSLFVRD
jgi:hypothetical protein